MKKLNRDKIYFLPSKNDKYSQDILFFYCPEMYRFRSIHVSDWKYATHNSDYTDCENMNLSVIDLKDIYHYENPDGLIELDMTKEEFENRFKLVEKLKS